MDMYIVPTCKKTFPTNTQWIQKYYNYSPH